MKHPIENVTWIDAMKLKGNGWNPNAVLMPELKILEKSILDLGWVQPILVNPSLIIIDGFHRWRLAIDSNPINRRDGGLVPCCILDVPDHKAMIMTIRMNRAKGTHVAVRMSSVIKKLINEYKLDPVQVAEEIGADKSEIDILLQDGIFRARNLGNYRYGRAWIPTDDGGRS